MNTSRVSCWHTGLGFRVRCWGTVHPVARGLTQWHGVCVQRMLANLLKYKKER